LTKTGTLKEGGKNIQKELGVEKGQEKYGWRPSLLSPRAIVIDAKWAQKMR